MKIIASVCARGGSKGVYKKNIRQLAGKPLIAHTIETALKCKDIDRVIVSSDDHEIIKISEEYGAEAPFIRPKELAEDTSPKWPVFQHLVKYLEDNKGENVDILVDLDPTSPLRKVQDIENCIDMLKNSEADIIVTVQKSRKNPYFNMVEQCGEYVSLVKKNINPVTRRQEAPAVYSMNASIYAVWRDFLFSHDSIFDGKVKAYVMSELAIDIDSEIDFQFIEFLIEKGIVEL